MLQFHLDENVALAIARGLRRRGIDVTTPADAGLLSATDEQHLAYALSANRVVVTHDDDFLRLSSRLIRHAGIAFCDPKVRGIGQIVRYLALMSACLEPDEMAGKVEFF